MRQPMTKAQKRSVSYYQREKRIVTDIARELGLDFSSAQRFIINEWHRMRQGSGQPEKHESDHAEATS